MRVRYCATVAGNSGADATKKERTIPFSRLTAEVFPGYVRIKGKKLGADAFNVYLRLKGESNFKLIAAKRSRFPFDDDSPLTQAGVPESREYRLMGVLADAEIGQSGDIVSVLFGG